METTEGQKWVKYGDDRKQLKERQGGKHNIRQITRKRETLTWKICPIASFWMDDRTNSCDG